jgi:hypothetical protein
MRSPGKTQSGQRSRQQASDRGTPVSLHLVFRIAVARNANEVWDLDNLIKPTLEAMEGVFGLRAWKGAPQPADDRADRIEAVKRLPHEGELPGATIDVWVLDPE